MQVVVVIIRVRGEEEEEVEMKHFVALVVVASHLFLKFPVRI